MIILIQLIYTLCLFPSLQNSTYQSFSGGEAKGIIYLCSFSYLELTNIHHLLNNSSVRTHSNTSSWVLRSINMNWACKCISWNFKIVCTLYKILSQLLKNFIDIDHFFCWSFVKLHTILVCKVLSIKCANFSIFFKVRLTSN